LKSKRDGVEMEQESLITIPIPKVMTDPPIPVKRYNTG